MSTVYYITTAEADRVKIGFTSNAVTSRLRELQTGSPHELCIIAAEPGTMDDERRLHARFAEHRLHGEWFTVGPEIKAHLRAINRRAYFDGELQGRGHPKWVRVFNALESGASGEVADAE